MRPLLKASAALLLSTTLTACSDPQTIYSAVLKQLNGSTETKDPWPPPRAAQDIHSRAPAIIDMHADTLVSWPEAEFVDRLLVNAERKGHVDVPRLIQGNVALQVFSAYSKGSLDTLGNALPAITGKYVDGAGTEHSRYDYVRDPDVPAYDDPNDPYVGDYTSIGMPRDVITYAFRVSRGQPYCETWYAGGNWDETLWGGPTPACPAYDPDEMYVDRLLDTARRLEALLPDGRIRKITTRAELDGLLAARSTNRNLVGALLSTEGLYFRSDVSTTLGQATLRANFQKLYDSGFRMFALTHFIDNDHAGASTGMGNATSAEGRGLSAAGRYVAELTFAHHAVLDAAHASPATIKSLAALAISYRKPLVFSHGGIQSAPTDEGDACQTDRNLTDELIRRVAETGGVIGLGFAKEFVCGTSAYAWARAVRRVVDVIEDQKTPGGPTTLYGLPGGTPLKGVDHVGLGTDYDGGVTAYTDVANLNQYTDALTCKRTLLRPKCLANPFSEEDAHKILGGNVLRVLRANLQ